MRLQGKIAALFVVFGFSITGCENAEQKKLHELNVKDVLSDAAIACINNQYSKGIKLATEAIVEAKKAGIEDYEFTGYHVRAGCYLESNDKSNAKSDYDVACKRGDTFSCKKLSELNM
ncbi:MAG TPA: hypothetical protein HPP97_11055 [Desulfuromonadales bacterium]|nr:hypothetical protein [Desulfuromonadales bacterium]